MICKTLATFYLALVNYQVNYREITKVTETYIWQFCFVSVIYWALHFKITIIFIYNNFKNMSARELRSCAFNQGKLLWEAVACRLLQLGMSCRWHL